MFLGTWNIYVLKIIFIFNVLFLIILHVCILIKKNQKISENNKKKSQLKNVL